MPPRRIIGVVVHVCFEDGDIEEIVFDDKLDAIRVVLEGAGNFTLEGQPKEVATQLIVQGIISERARYHTPIENPKAIEQ